jgi:hypothetical protein
MGLGWSGCAAAILALATPAHALRVATWNITNYPSVSLAARQPLFRTVIPALNPDSCWWGRASLAATRSSTTC